MRPCRPHAALRSAVQQANQEHPRAITLALRATRWPLVASYFYRIDEIVLSDSPRDLKALRAVAALVRYVGPLTEPIPEPPVDTRRLRFVELV